MKHKIDPIIDSVKVGPRIKGFYRLENNNW